MRVKRQKAKDMALPNELFVQPQLLEQLSQSQDKGLIYYGEQKTAHTSDDGTTTNRWLAR